MSTTDVDTTTACPVCGVPVIYMTVRGRRTALNATEHPAGPYVIDTGAAVWDPHRRTDGKHRRIRHQCLHAPSQCKYCGGPVLVLNLDPTTPRERFPGTWLVVVEPYETADGVVQITPDGWARWRTEDDTKGYPWHTKH